MTRTATTLFALAGLVLAMGCKKKTPEAPEPEPEPVVEEAPAPPPAPAVKPLTFGPVVGAVHFDTGGTEVAADQLDAVREAADIMKDSDWVCAVVGLADASGDAAMNKELSQTRAEAVAAKLIEFSGVSADRVKAKGIGEKLATGASQSERKVEFVFFKDTTGRPLKQVVIKSGVLEEDFRAKKSTK